MKKVHQKVGRKSSRDIWLSSADVGVETVQNLKSTWILVASEDARKYVKDTFPKVPATTPTTPFDRIPSP